MRILKPSFLPVLAAAALFAGASAHAAERKVTLVVKNMSCATCAPTVKRALTGVKGVKAASIGKIVGQGFPADKITDAVETVVDTYIDLRNDSAETFLETYRRVGEQPFKERLYGNA